MQKFCHHCGKQVVLGANFCPFCGTSLSSLSATPTPPAPRQAVRPPAPTFTPFATRNDEDDEAVDKMEHLEIRIAGLEVELTKDNPQMGEKLGSVLQQGAAGLVQPVGPRGGKYGNVDTKTFLEEFKREAGTRNPNEPAQHIS